MYEAVFIIVILVLLSIVFAICDFVGAYKKESKHIKMEIARSCTKSEKIHWQHELQRLKRRFFPWMYMFRRKKK